MLLARRSSKSWIARFEWLVATVLVVANAWFLFSFLRSIPFPVGDDPGLHTTLIAGLLKHNGTNFELPIFPQVHTPFPDRSATALLGWQVGKLLHITDPLVISVGLAAAFFALTSICVYFLALVVVEQPLAALFAPLFWSWAHWGQETFWEGGYDQITSLPLFILYLTALWLAFKKRHWLPAVLAIVALGGLFKLHQLSFFAALIIGLTAFVLWLKEQTSWIVWFESVGALLIALVVVFAKMPAYFPLNKTGYPLPLLLSGSEGIHQLVPFMAAIGAFVLFWKKPAWSFAIVLVPILISQSGILGFGFYPFRFNVYAMASIGVLLSLTAATIVEALEGRDRILSIVALGFLVVIAAPVQRRYIVHYKWYLTDEVVSPAAVILKDDNTAFHWMRDNLPQDANIAAPFKWGYYLPAVADRDVTLNDPVGGDKRDNRYPYAATVDAMYTTKVADEAAALARSVGVTHVFVDGSFAKYPDRYPNYDMKKFEDTRFFKLVYDKNATKIYEIR